MTAEHPFARFVAALGRIKYAAAEVNNELGLLEDDKCAAIKQAAEEVIAGGLDEHFVVDVYQTGSGTSSNMNANEVIANRALQLMGHELGDYARCHPNNHVNLSQSTNDVYPTAVRLAGIFKLRWSPDATQLVGVRGDDLVVSHGASRLDDGRDAGCGRCIDTIAEREKGI